MLYIHVDAVHISHIVFKQNHIQYAPVRMAIYVTSECLINVVTYMYLTHDNNNIIKNSII